MEDQTIQQAIILVKLVTLKRDRASITLLEHISNGLVCLMIASKI